MLTPRQTPGSLATSLSPEGWRLEIPAGPAGRYRLAQVDDYADLARRSFPWQPPFSLSLRARASQESIPGTWGFGLWNDPFSLSLGFGGAQRSPALPDAAWFFFASPPNYLSLHDDLPAQGGLAATFQSQRISPVWMALGSIALPALALPPLARRLRRLGRRFVSQDAALLTANPVEWHKYQMDWESDRVVFRLDGSLVLETRVTPVPPLGLVMWVDNQYAAWPPDGRVKFGALANHQPAWIEIDEIRIA